jgi:hypothetical protein
VTISCGVFRSWPVAEIDPQLFALFFKELLLDDELADFAFQTFGTLLLALGGLVHAVLALEEFGHAFFEFLLSGAYLRGRDLVLVGNVLDAFSLFEGFFGDAGFKLRTEVSSLSFHWSDFVVICPFRPDQLFNKLLAPFPGTTSVA